MKTYNYKINGNDYQVDINSIEGNHAVVTVHGVAYQVDMEGISTQEESQPQNPVVHVATSPKTQSKPSDKGKSVKAPLPGVIVSVKVNVGDKVKAGQVIATLEAMKMENDLESEYNGTVTSIHVEQGESVLEGATIVTIA